MQDLNAETQDNGLERREFVKLAAGFALLGGGTLTAHGARAAPSKSPAIDTVNRFLDAYWSLKPDPAVALVNEDFIWVNMPMADSPIYTIKGKDALRKMMTSNNGGFPEAIEAGTWKPVFALSSNEHVLHERVDRYKLRGKWFELPCNAHWIVRDGKISSWRDYFDFGTYVRQMESIGIKVPS